MVQTVDTNGLVEVVQHQCPYLRETGIESDLLTDRAWDGLADYYGSQGDQTQFISRCSLRVREKGGYKSCTGDPYTAYTHCPQYPHPQGAGQTNVQYAV